MHIRKALGAAALLLGSLTPAAAQMATGGAWNGFYGGLNLGGGWLDGNASLSPTGCFATVGGCGPAAGGGGASRGFSRSLNGSGPL